MRYLIDGYNLFFRIQQETDPLQKHRERFLKDLVMKIKILNIHATLIFDSNHKYANFLPSCKTFETVDVVFSPKNLSADCYILELLTWNSHLITLVTSDQELALQAKNLGAHTQSIEEFIALLLKQNKDKRTEFEDKPIIRESEANLQRLLKIFEQQLSQDENV